jgi:transcriptional regulator with XRE-family HTH domain
MTAELDRKQYRSVGSLLRALRERHRLTLDQLGERAAVAPAQLCRYERDTVEPSIATMRRILAAFGWAPTFGLEPTTAAIDEKLAVNKNPFQLCEIEVIALVEIAACAAGDGTALVLGGEIATVLQGLPAATVDVVIHVHPDHVKILAAAAAAHRQITEGRDGELELWSPGSSAIVRLSEVMPPSTMARLDFAPWLKRQEVPVVTLAELIASDALGPTARRSRRGWPRNEALNRFRNRSCERSDRSSGRQPGQTTVNLLLILWALQAPPVFGERCVLALPET